MHDVNCEKAFWHPEVSADNGERELDSQVPPVLPFSHESGEKAAVENEFSVSTSVSFHFHVASVNQL